MALDLWSSIAGVLMVMAITLSFYEIIRHLCNFTKPYLQRYIIRILLMVPIYSINAWVAMILPSAGLYLDSFREIYESFVIYSFMKYLLNFLHYDTNLQQYIDFKPGPSHIVPLCCLPPCVGGKSFMVRCKHGILQYVVVRPLTTVIAFTSQIFDFYGEGNYNPLSGYTYPVLLLINNASQIIAMYCLVIFYSGYQRELNPMNPLAKFFSIKLVVFFSFFQSVVIAGLIEVNFIEDTLGDLFPDAKDKITIGRKLQEFLICIDMVIAALGHLFAFPHRQFVGDDFSPRTLNEDDASNWEGNARLERRYLSSDSMNGSPTCCMALCDILDFNDEKSDMSEHFSQIFSRLRAVFRFRPQLPEIVSGSTPSSAGHSNENINGSPAYETNRVPINSLTGAAAPIRNYDSIQT